MLLDPTTVYVLGVIFVATLIRSTLGFGEALVAVPLLALRTPIVAAGGDRGDPHRAGAQSSIARGRFFRAVYVGLVVIGGVLIAQALAR